MQLQPLVRVILIGLAAGLGVIASVQDQLPLLVQALLVALSTTFAGLGITPPQVPTRTVVDTERRAVNVVSDESGYGLVELAIALLIFVVAIVILLRIL